MLGSLESLLANPATQYTKSVIKSGLRTPQGEKLVWIVVEDIDDVEVYKRYVKSDHTRILPSSYEVDGQARKGFSFLERIVDEILNEEDNPHILGIRDKDYTKYEEPAHVFPQNIFYTDYRDVEMMLFSAQSVLDGLKSWDPQFPEKLEEVKIVTRKLGYMRICNHLYSLGCNFKKNVKISKIWNENSHSLLGNWEEHLMSIFLSSCGNHDIDPFTEEKYNHTIAVKGLDNESDLDICQGHDTVRLLQYMMIKKEYSETNIMNCMTQSYSLTDIRKTRLYADLSSWGSYRGLDFLLS